MKGYLAWFVRAIRAAKNKVVDWIATQYYRYTCRRFGTSSVVQWGTWICDPTEIEIGDDVYIARGVEVGAERKGARLTIENNVQINRNVKIDYSGDLLIGSCSLISENAVIYTHTHGLDPRSPATFESKVIESNCWIGASAVIMSGCKRVARGVIVGIGSVVTKDLTSPGTYAGVPAKRIS
jgi:acetyltransferase-like isoleucine patch superfamily enzyme